MYTSLKVTQTETIKPKWREDLNEGAEASSVNRPRPERKAAVKSGSWQSV